MVFIPYGFTTWIENNSGLSWVLQPAPVVLDFVSVSGGSEAVMIGRPKGFPGIPNIKIKQQVMLAKKQRLQGRK